MVGRLSEILQNLKVICERPSDCEIKWNEKKMDYRHQLFICAASGYNFLYRLGEMVDFYSCMSAIMLLFQESYINGFRFMFAGMEL